MRHLLACAIACALSSCGIAPAAADSIPALVDRAASAAGVPRHIAHAVIRQESNYRPHLRGRAGEWGLGQIKCQTARGVGFTGRCSQLADPATNLAYSMRYLRLALNRGGTGCAGVSLYQSGIHGPRRCSAYGAAVMAKARSSPPSSSTGDTNAHFVFDDRRARAVARRCNDHAGADRRTGDQRER